MSTARQERVPELTLGWRLQMALADRSAQGMADDLGVSRATISRWMHDVGAPPRRAYLAQWALICNVDAGWLEHGAESVSPTPPPEGSRNHGDLERLTEQKRRRARRSTSGHADTDGYATAA